MTDTPYFDALARRMLPHRRMLDFTTGEDGGVAPILMARNPFAFALGPVKMTELTGVDQSLIPASLVTTVPFLVAPTKGYTPGRWPGVKPEALWMPWLWLPERLARPSVTDGMVEPVVVWQARVALELAVSDLFDAQDGWVDVLRTFAALDVDDETDMTRVTAWLHGGADPDLDAIPPTIADQFLPADTDDPDWAASGATLLTVDTTTDESGTGKTGPGPLWVAGAGLLCGLIDEMIDDPDVTDWWVPALAGALPIWDEHTAEGWQHALNTAHAGNTALSRELVGVLRPGLKQWDAAGEEAYAVVTDLVRDMFDLSMVTTQPGG